VGPDDRRRLALVLVEAGVTLALWWLTNPGRPAVRPWVLYHTMRGAQGAARTFGQLGMKAELRYREEIR
jgi:hypothetical protein